MMILDNVMLGPVLESDKDTLFAWINDPEIVRFNAAFKPVCEHAHTEWMKKIGAQASSVAFAIRQHPDEQLIGVVQLTDIHPVHRSAQLSIRIGNTEHRGKGFGSKALALVTRFGFRNLNLNRIALEVFADNTRAIAAYEKSGFRKEGVLRQACFIEGEWKDVVCMAILKEQSSDI